MENNEFETPPNTVPAVRENAPIRRSDASFEERAAELDGLAVVPTEVLAEWVTARGQCLWETPSVNLAGRDAARDERALQRLLSREVREKGRQPRR